MFFWYTSPAPCPNFKPPFLVSHSGAGWTILGDLRITNINISPAHTTHTPTLNNQSMLDCISAVSMLIGISIYNRYMSTWKYRTIFIATQLLMVGAGMLDYAFVKRMNLAVGISDKAFVIGDEVSCSSLYALCYTKDLTAQSLPSFLSFVLLSARL